MITHEGLDRNFRFMVLEINRQLKATRRLIAEPSEKLIHRVVARDSYIDTLKSLIERKSLSYFRHTPTMDEKSASMVTAVNVVATNLERIADFCVNIVLNLQRLTTPTFLQRFNFDPYFDEMLSASNVVVMAIAQRDTNLALQLCQTESKLDAMYAADFHRIRTELRSGQNTDDLLISLYIFHYLERMGDSLLNIGEAVLFAATGEKLKLHEYLRLREVLGKERPQGIMSDYSLAFNWETRSGSRIGKVEEKSEAQGEETEDFEGIFKKGRADKLRREKENIERWEQILPGVPPKVLEFTEEEQDAALLLEFLDGFTFQDLIVNGERTMIERAAKLTQDALQRLWSETRSDEPVNGTFMEQTQERLVDVFEVHPDFKSRSYELGSLSLPSLEDLIQQVRKIEGALPAPFNVLIHGDFNTDNIIYNYHDDTIHFIDLHRSRRSDYVQDMSIFLVSNFRMPLFRPDIRNTLNEIMLCFFEFARGFAGQTNDKTFDVRMALGLARAFITSTRFELESRFAEGMYMRSVYLLEKVIRHAGKPWKDFALSEEILEY
jgi:phosphate uptake regulator/aminoglycoside phosphotransferase (APT) family kinase protein